MRLWPCCLLLVAGCGGSSSVTEPPTLLDGSYSGSWDAPLLKHYGTVSFTVKAGKMTGTASNTVTGQSAKFSGTVSQGFSADTFSCRWKYADRPFDQAFTGSLLETSPGYTAYCSLDDGDEPKKFMAQVTMALSRK